MCLPLPKELVTMTAVQRERTGSYGAGEERHQSVYDFGGEYWHQAFNVF
jgi:hypothetical protein